MLRVCYFVHDLSDPAVARRARMLQDGGALVTLAGFSRGEGPDLVAGIPPLRLGRTQPGRLVRRIATVLQAATRLRVLRALVSGADVILARQLETLVLAAWARRLFAPQTPLVFECLDIHRSMLGRRVVSVALRRLEAWLLRQCALLIVSSPAFLTRHFNRYAHLPRSRLVENKVLASEARTPASRPPRGDRPWRIGWFGVIRCARSLALLSDLVRTQGGQVEVVIRGRPAMDAVPGFQRVIDATPGLHYHGPYDRLRDLPRIYGDVDFTWAIDFFEAGGNSDWLLPNRLYEGRLYGSVPLATRASQTGCWLAERDAGVLLDEPLGQSLPAFFAQLTQPWYAASANTIRIQDVVYDRVDCRGLVADLRALGAYAERRSKVRTSMAL